jgi:hypothetical protein
VILEVILVLVLVILLVLMVLVVVVLILKSPMKKHIVLKVTVSYQIDKRECLVTL